MKRYLFLFLAISVAFVSCVDRDFDEPPANGSNPEIDPAQIITIDEILDLYIPGEFTAVNQDKFLDVLVTADDQSGNFFRSLIIQDATGGISIQIDDVELWNKYPQGRRIFINVQELWVGDFNGLPQLGFDPFDDDGRMTLGRIPSSLLDDIILRGELNNEVVPVELDLTQLGNSALNTVVAINDLQFIDQALGQTFADAANLGAVNHTIQDCSGNNIILRTSGFASFAAEMVPEGNGRLVAVYGIFGSDKQLLLRNLDDIAFEGDRCDEQTIDVDPSLVIDLRDLMNQFYTEGQDTPLPSENYLQGVVVSNDEAGNFFKVLTIQDENTGITVLVDAFDLFESYPPGTEVYLSLNNLYIGDFNGLPQIGYLPSTSNVRRIPESFIPNYVIKTGNVVNIAPRSVSIADLSTDMLNQLVELDDVQFNDDSANQTYADGDNNFSINHILEDCDDNAMIVRTSGFADFADERTPNGKGNIQGVLQIFSGDYQILIRDTGDVDMTGPRCDGSGGSTGGGNEESADQTFDDLIDFEDIELNGWTNVATKGDRVWFKRSFSGNGFAETEAFQDDNPETENWLVTPAINTSETSNLSFESAVAFYQHDGLKVMVSSDFTGDVSAASWTDLEPTLAGANEENYDWVPSGDIDLSVHGASVHVAFMYTGTAAQNTTKVRIDNVKVQ